MYRERVEIEMKHKRRTEKRWLAGLLSLVLAFCLLPGTALAEGDNLITTEFTLEKIVQKGGLAAPLAETFTFELTDTANVPKQLSDYGITMMDELTISTKDAQPVLNASDGSKAVTKTVHASIEKAKINTTYGWETVTPVGSQEPSSYYKTFLLTEKNDGKDGWTYSTKQYALKFNYDIATGKMALTLHESIGSDVTFRTAAFTNTYKGQEATQSFVLNKKVEKGGEATPPTKTFAFELADTASAPRPLSDYGITMDELNIATTGAGTFSKTVNVQFDLTKANANNGWTGYGDAGSQNTRWYSKTFLLTEKDDGAAGWTYSAKKYAVTFKYTIESGEMMLTLHEPGNDATYQTADFTNTYTQQAPGTKTVKIPFTKEVTLGGNTNAGSRTFELDIFDIGNRNTGEYANVAYTAKVTTNGKGTYNNEIVITGPANEIAAYTSEGFYVREKNTGAANWTYSDAVWHIMPQTAVPEAEQKLVIYPTRLEHTANGDHYTDLTTPVEKMTFTNTYTYNTSSGGSSSSGATITVNKTDAVNAPLSGAVFVLENSRGREAYTATSNARGVARFTDVTSGTYTLREKSAPAGYVASDEAYELTVGGTRVTMGNKSYSPVTFVNRKTAEMNRTDHFAFLIGYQDGTFGPERNMTRAEVTTMFTRLLTERIDADKTYPNTFSDVPAGYWAANYIGYAQQFGIVMGFDDGSFRPDAPVTRAQFAAIACRFEKLTEGSKSFSDVPDSYWAAKYINFAATRGWVTGYADGTFKPENHITRAEVAAVTCRLLERSADQSYIRSHLNTLPRTFTDMTESHWAYWYALEAANGHDYTRSGSSETWTRTYQ